MRASDSSEARRERERLRLAGVDGRRKQAKRYRALILSFEEEFGGRDRLSASDMTSIQTLAAVTVSIEGLQARMAHSDATVSPDAIVRLSGVAMRISKTLTQRHGKPAERHQTLRQYLASRDRGALR